MLFSESFDSEHFRRALEAVWKNKARLKASYPHRETNAFTAYQEFMFVMGADSSQTGHFPSHPGRDQNQIYADNARDFFIENSKAIVEALNSDDKGETVSEDTRNFFLNSLIQAFPDSTKNIA